MPTANDYRAFALCQRRIAENSSSEIQQHYLSIARRWEAIADEAEQTERLLTSIGSGRFG